MNPTLLNTVTSVPFIAILSILFFQGSLIHAEGNLTYLAETETGSPVVFFDFGRGTINLNSLPEKLTFVAIPDGNRVKSIYFYLNGKQVKKENVFPYAIAGDDNGQLTPYDIPLGQFRLTIKQFSAANGGGELIFQEDLDLCVVNLEIPKLSVNPGQDALNVQAGAQKTSTISLELSAHEEDFSLKLDPSSELPDWFTIADPLRFGENDIVLDASHLLPGEYFVSVGLISSLKAQACFSLTSYKTFRVIVQPSDNFFIAGFQMVDSETDQEACRLPDDFFSFLGNVFTYDWYCLPDSFSLVTQTYGNVGSIVFEYSYTAPGQAEQPLHDHRTENIAPFTLFGDQDNDYVGMPKQSGMYKIRATPYSGKKGTGTAGKPLLLEFRILNQLTLVKEQEVLRGQVEAGTTQQFPFKILIEGNEPEYQLALDFLSGPSFIQMASPLQEGKNALAIDARNQLPGQWNFSLGVSVEALDPQFSPYVRDFMVVPVEITIVPGEEIFVHQFEIGDSEQDQFHYRTHGGDLGDFSWNTLPENIYIRALPYGDVGSIVFDYAYSTPKETEKEPVFFRKENIAPYSLMGDQPPSDAPDYQGFVKEAGVYKVKATPYSARNGKGLQGNPLEIRFRVLPNPDAVQAKPSTMPTSATLSVYPNPVSETTVLRFVPKASGNVCVEVYDLQGALVKEVFTGFANSGDALQIALLPEGIHEGIYLCRVVSAEGVVFKRIFVN